MLERFKRKPAAREDAAADRGGVATAEREYGTRTEPRFGRERVADHETAHAVRARQREEFGGINWGSAFFGWLVAVGMAAILLGLLSAAGTAFGLSEVSDAEAESNAEAIGIVGAILLILVLAAAYYCGGYVSGRMSRFDGGRQGLAVWALGLAVTIALAVAGVLFGAEYNVLEQLNLPRIPVEEGSLTAGAAIALAAVLIATLVAAIGGGKAGERYHHKVDRFGYRD
jgi:MFS family permease